MSRDRVDVDPSKPNHFFVDSLGDPLTCTGDHNHPTAENESAINADLRSRKSYTSRNSSSHWSAANYRYYLGQRVLVVEGTRAGMLEGSMGTVTELPSEGQPYLGVQRDTVKEPEKPGWSPGAGVVPLRRVLEIEIEVLSKRIKARRQKLKQLDELGRPLDGPATKP